MIERIECASTETTTERNNASNFWLKIRQKKTKKLESMKTEPSDAHSNTLGQQFTSKSLKIPWKDIKEALQRIIDKMELIAYVYTSNIADPRHEQ